MSDVYFLFAPRANVIKIGVAANPHKRVRGLQTPEPCRLVGLLPGVGAEGEHALHCDFAELRVHGEWFKAAPKLRAYVERHAFDVPVDTWRAVKQEQPRRRARTRQHSRRPQSGTKRKNRAIAASADDRIFFVYECYDAEDALLYVARSISPESHWAEQKKHLGAAWSATVARFKVRGPYTRSVAAKIYSDLVQLRDPIHVASAPTSKAAALARREFFRTAMRGRMDKGETWEQALLPAQEEADAIDFREFVTERNRAAT